MMHNFDIISWLILFFESSLISGDYNNLGQNEQLFMSYISSSIARIVFNLYGIFSVAVTANSYTKHFPLGPIEMSCGQKLQRIFL